MEYREVYLVNEIGKKGVANSNRLRYDFDRTQ